MDFGWAWNFGTAQLEPARDVFFFFSKARNRLVSGANVFHLTSGQTARRTETRKALLVSRPETRATRATIEVHQ